MRSDAPIRPIEDELLQRYAQAKALQPDGLPEEPSAALRERIMQSAREAPIAMHLVASSPDSARARGQKSIQEAMPSAANDNFWSLRVAASVAVMGLSALLWWQLEQGSPQEQEAVRSAQPAAASERLHAPEAPPSTPSTRIGQASPDHAAAAPAAAPQVAMPSPPAPEQAKQAATAASPAPPTLTADARSPGLSSAPAAQEAAAPLASRSEAAELPASREAVGPSASVSAQTQPATSMRRATPAPASPPAPPTPQDNMWNALQARQADALRQALAEGASARAIDAQGQPALHQAVLRRWPEGVRILLQAGADPQAPNKNGHTAADVAQERGFDEILALLRAAPR